ncbi:carbohydrate ABC transporter permease [Streptomyces sp. NBC_01619]|uniref:Carbohydrate ABC transporter permease n=1 Tax=Streptomyces pratisoli TaxID=3139917 RepID=A0ACC6QUB2_9ACTN|nr:MULTISPECIES: carbohydrate ABC transporter permease [unclassified Streptomyces]MCX4515410.1 carbohydrate ABC transporter permease [Streptomyces sp. NBC_01619]
MSLALEEQKPAAENRGGRPAWKEKPHPLMQGAKAVALALTVLMVAVPFWVVIATSFAPGDQITQSGGWALWPERWTFDSYDKVLSNEVTTHALLVSIGITVVGTLFSLACTVFLAYALARPGVVGGKPMMLIILFTFLFPPGIIPSYLVVYSLGLVDTYWSLFLPVLVNVFNLVVVRGFFQGIPEELYEAARLDGAGEVRTLFTIVLPLSKAVIAVVGLFYAVGYWNDFFRGLMYLNDTSMYPLQTVLRGYVTQGDGLNSEFSSEGGVAQAPQSMKMALVLIATVPILCVYPFIQRYFTKGVLTGAIKS